MAYSIVKFERAKSRLMRKREKIPKTVKLLFGEPEKWGKNLPKNLYCYIDIRLQALKTFMKRYEDYFFTQFLGEKRKLKSSPFVLHSYAKSLINTRMDRLKTTRNSVYRKVSDSMKILIHNGRKSLVRNGRVVKYLGRIRTRQVRSSLSQAKNTIKTVMPRYPPSIRNGLNQIRNTLIKSIQTGLYRIGDYFKNINTQFFDLIGTIRDTLKSILEPLLNLLADILRELLELFLKALEPDKESVKQSIRDYLDVLEEVQREIVRERIERRRLPPPHAPPRLPVR